MPHGRTTSDFGVLLRLNVARKLPKIVLVVRFKSMRPHTSPRGFDLDRERWVSSGQVGNLVRQLCPAPESSMMYTWLLHLLIWPYRASVHIAKTIARKSVGMWAQEVSR